MKMNLSKSGKGDVSTLVVLAAKDSKSSKPVSGKLSAGVLKLLDSAQTDGGFSGDKKESLFFRAANVDGFKNILFVGLGDAKTLTGESLRNTGATIFNALKGNKVTSAGISADSFLKLFKDPAQAVQALVEGDHPYHQS